MEKVNKLFEENDNYKSKIEALEKRLEVMEKVSAVMPQITTFLGGNSPVLPPHTQATPSYTIAEMLDRMLFKANNCTTEKNRKRNLLRRELFHLS